MTWTLALATYAAATGTAGTAFGFGGRRDAVWARRARSRDLRTNLEPLRDALAEAKATPQRTASLTSGLTFRAHVQAIGEGVHTCPDRRTRRYLTEVNRRCLTVVNTAATAQDHVSYALTDHIEQALKAVTTGLERLEKIDRRAPG